MTESTQTLSFQAEAKELLDLVVHSLYSHREVFLRELVSNASDALDKLRREALETPGLLEDPESLAIRLEVDPKARTLSVIDNGIGMTREELTRYLGTIAHSGTRELRRNLEAQAVERPDASSNSLIGQFGVGFYSAFGVAHEVTVESQRAGSVEAWRWRSRGDGEFQVEPALPRARGTRVTLALKPRGDDDEEWQDFTSGALLARLVRRNSDFIEWPIELATAQLDQPGELERRRGHDGIEVFVLNSRRPLWERPRDQIQPDEYRQLFAHLSHGEEGPLETVHFKAEGTQEYTALLFVPAERRESFLERPKEHAAISLYARRVFVMDHCPHLAPSWLRFLSGVVDSRDLPLNVSREVLQENRLLRQIHNRIVQKTLQALAHMQAQRRPDYERFFSSFGAVLKEGLLIDPARRDELLDLCLFQSSRGGWTSCAEYLARAPAEQGAIYVHGAPSLALARNSVFAEALSAKGREVLFLLDPVDEWILAQVEGVKEKRFVVLERDAPDWESAAEKEQREAKEREQRGFLERLERALAPRVRQARFSARLVDSPAVLVAAPGALGPHMRRMLEQRGDKPAEDEARDLELHPGHPFVQRLIEREASAGGDFDEAAELLYGQALLAQGLLPADPRRFAALLSKTLLDGSGAFLRSAPAS